VQLVLRIVALVTSAVVGVQTSDASDNWIDHAAADPFVCRSEFRLHDGQQLMRELKQLESDIQSLLELSPGQRPIQLNLFRGRRSYAGYMSARVPDAAGRKAIFVEGPDMGRVYVYKSLSQETDIRHECTHAVLHGSLPYVPLWLDEGLAEYFEVEATKRIAANPYLRSLKPRLLFGWKPNLPALEAKQHFSELTEDDYREAWACFLAHRSDDSRTVLIEYLRDIQSGAPPGPLSERIATHIPDAESQLVEHFQRFGQFKFFAN
jgi:hypothetical protein